MGLRERWLLAAFMRNVIFIAHILLDFAFYVLQANPFTYKEYSENALRWQVL